MVNLERDKKEIYDTKAAILKREKELLTKQQEYEELRDYVDTNRRELLKQAKEEARQILKDANKLVENTIAEIKSVQADKEKTREIRSTLHQAIDKHSPVKPAVAKPISKSDVAADQDLKVGDWVRLRESGAEAQVMEIAKNKNLILALGELRTVVKPAKVEKLQGKEKKKAAKRIGSLSTGDAAD
ncbi:hypothetical protein M8994_22155, partial [Brucella sp. 21LCYQ03]|nr:hypothetical protein [Brucella sp. 21LCYQ03]